MASITPGPWSSGACRSASQSSGSGWKPGIPAPARSDIRGLRLLKKSFLAQPLAAVEYALGIDVIDPDSLRTIVEHRTERPAELFRSDGRPHLAHVRVETTRVASDQASWKEGPHDRHQEHGPA